MQGLGLSMQEALVFWRRAFQAKIPEDKFNKSYAYNIRYNYGQEGKRADFAPYRHAAQCARSPCRGAPTLTACAGAGPICDAVTSCMRIIMNNPPGPGDHHGCPFRHFSPENLRAKLKCVLRALVAPRAAAAADRHRATGPPFSGAPHARAGHSTWRTRTWPRSWT